MRLRRFLLRGLLVLLVLLVAGGIGGYWYERPLLLTGTGYAAHNACAVQTIAGRQDSDADLPPNPLVPYLRSGDARTDRPIRSSILGVLATQRAFPSGAFGCTLAERSPDWPTPIVVDSAANPLADAAAPTAAPAVADALAKAFGDDLSADDRLALGARGIVALHDGQLIGERYADGFSAETPQLGWSMTKSVTNLMTGRLVAQDKIALTDDHLRPEWTDERATITVDQLLRMTSGLSWDETYSLGTPITRMLYTEPDMAGYVSSLPLTHAPGSYQQYSSGSTNVLCAVLDERAGDLGPNLPRQEILGPLGLASATFEADAAGTPVCSSYLWATPRDWATIGQFALQDGVWGGERLLPKGWMAASVTAQPVAESEEKGYAAGWWVNLQADGTLVQPLLPPDTYWAQGHDGQRLYVVPSAKLVVARLGFSPGIDSADLRTVELVRDLLAADLNS